MLVALVPAVVLNVEEAAAYKEAYACSRAIWLNQSCVMPNTYCPAMLVPAVVLNVEEAAAYKDAYARPVPSG
jgi:hypothetical protein